MSSLQGQLQSLTNEYTQRVVAIVQKAISDAVSSSLHHASAAPKAASAPAAAKKKRGRPAKAKPAPVAVVHHAAPAKKPAKASKRAKGAKRAPEEIAATTTALQAYVKAHAGQRIEQIAKGMKISTKDLALPAKKLLGDRKMKTKGQKRATQYFPALAPTSLTR